MLDVRGSEIQAVSSTHNAQTIIMTMCPYGPCNFGPDKEPCVVRGADATLRAGRVAMVIFAALA